MKKHCQRRIVDPTACARVLVSSMPYSEAHAVEICNIVRSAVEALRGGSGDDEDYNRACWAFNVASFRAHAIDKQADSGGALLEIMQDGSRALRDCGWIRAETGSYGFTQPGLADLLHALDYHDEIIRASSPNQMLAAEAAFNAQKREEQTA
jgi:hypothetical protein